MFRTLIFDLDDTLLDTTRLLIPQAEREACEAMIKAGLNANLEACLKTRRELIKTNLRAQIFEASVRELGVRDGAIEKDVAQAGTRAFYEREVESNIYLDSAVTHLLEKMKTKYDLFLVTAGSVKTQAKKVEILKIAQYFKQIIYVDLSRGQTKAQAFEQVRELSGALPENILSIGDRIDTDVALAKSLGMKTCWVVKGEYAKLKPLSAFEEPDFQVKQVTQIESVCQL